MSKMLVALMVLSVLQICLMNGSDRSIEAQSHQEKVLVKPAMVDASSHACCVDDSAEWQQMELPCPQCAGDSPGLQLLHDIELLPSYVLMYLVMIQVLDQLPLIRLWQQFTEPEILASLPDIFLTKSAFLE